MPRYLVRIPLADINRLQLDRLIITIDNMITRNRDLLIVSPELSVALSRLAIQLIYRLASERYQVTSRYIVFNIELTKDESEALLKHYAKITFNLDTSIRYYDKILKEGKAKNKSAVHDRILSLRILRDIITSIVEQFEEMVGEDGDYEEQ